MARPHCIVRVLLIVAVALSIARLAIADSTTIEPAILLAPANGVEIQANSDPTHVTLVWKADLGHERARFFVEVVAIDSNKLSDVFASYVNQTTVTVTLEDEPAEYAWRVYTVGENDPEYALSDWYRFSIRATQ